MSINYCVRYICVDAKRCCRCVIGSPSDITAIRPSRCHHNRVELTPTQINTLSIITDLLYVESSIPKTKIPPSKSRMLQKQRVRLSGCASEDGREPANAHPFLAFERTTIQLCVTLLQRWQEQDIGADDAVARNHLAMCMSSVGGCWNEAPLPILRPLVGGDCRWKMSPRRSLSLEDLNPVEVDLARKEVSPRS